MGASAVLRDDDAGTADLEHAYLTTLHANFVVEITEVALGCCDANRVEERCRAHGTQRDHVEDHIPKAIDSVTK